MKMHTSPLEQPVEAKKLLFKKFAKVISEFKTIPLSQSYELLSQEAGYKDWNTASAEMQKANTIFIVELALRTEAAKTKTWKTDDEEYRNNRLTFIENLLAKIIPADSIECAFYSAFKKIITGNNTHYEYQACPLGLKTHMETYSQLAIDYNYLAEVGAEVSDTGLQQGLFSLVGNFKTPVEVWAACLECLIESEVWLSFDANSLFEKLSMQTNHWTKAFSEEGIKPLKIDPDLMGELKGEWSYQKQLLWELNEPSPSYKEEVFKLRPAFFKAAKFLQEMNKDQHPS